MVMTKVLYWFCAIVVALVCLLGVTRYGQLQFVKYLNQLGYSDVNLQYKFAASVDSKCLFHNRGQLYSFVAKEGSGVVCQKGFSKIHEVTAY